MINNAPAFQKLQVLANNLSNVCHDKERVISINTLNTLPVKIPCSRLLIRTISVLIHNHCHQHEVICISVTLCHKSSPIIGY